MSTAEAQFATEAPALAASQRLHGFASAIEVVSWLMLGVCVLVGLVLSLITERSGTDGGVERPYVLAGLLIVGGGVFHALFVVMVARYIKLRTAPGQ